MIAFVNTSNQKKKAKKPHKTIHNSLAPFSVLSLFLSSLILLLLFSASLGCYSSWINGIFVAKLSAAFDFSSSCYELFVCI